MFQVSEMPDMWTTNQEFLDLNGGDYEEHAILMANYFNFIDKATGKNYLSCIVMGRGMPHGAMVYVLRKKTLQAQNFELWDPLSARCYYYGIDTNARPGGLFGMGKASGPNLVQRITDPVCPMTQVHCIINHSNVWVNQMKSDYPLLMDFDMTKTKNWRQFLSTDAQARIGPSVQTNPLIYAEPKLQQNERIELRIQKYLVERFQEERIKKVRKTTKWAVSANDELVKILLDCEKQMQMARNGGVNSELLDERRKNAAGEHIDIETIAKVSAQNKASLTFCECLELARHRSERPTASRLGIPYQLHLHLPRKPVEEGPDHQNARRQQTRRRIQSVSFHPAIPL